MVTSSKQRIAILIVVLLGNVGSLLLSSASQYMENSINYQEAYFFEGEQYISFNLHNASSQTTHELLILGNTLNETHTFVELTLDGDKIGDYYVNPAGWLYVDGILNEELYSIWWIYVPNRLIFFGVEVGDTFSVIDPTGFFGPENARYSYEVEAKFVFYPYLEDHRNLMGAQASFEAGLYTDQEHKKIGIFLFDTTSGALEQADYHFDGSYYQLLLTNTSYGISRNRFVLVVINMILGLVISCIWFFIGRLRHKKNKSSLVPKERREQIEFFLLLGSGFICKTLDIVDTWFYHRISYEWTIIIDLSFAGLLTYICYRGDYGYKWILPSLFELTFARPHRGRQVIPFIGNFLGWMAVLWASGIPHPMENIMENNLAEDKIQESKKRKIWSRILDKII